MKSNEIRELFLNYFKKNGHEIVHSGSLVPKNDPTLMFSNSGMVQFKNVFTGKESRNYKRAVTSQKCVRAGGKHNDLEQVGYTTRHHTFFEMLGNFSFGDYFKDYAIELAWKLITEEFNIDKNKLLITVFYEDDESFNYWKKISGLNESKIIKIDTSDNFWSMGETGPCGPCSEIFYDHGDKFQGGPPGSKNEDGDRFIEIWNLVFMQYEQISKEKRNILPKPSIDTGMGLERITALLNETNDNYATDVFKPLIEKSIELTNNEKFINSPSHKVISDHLRSSAFLISDGVLPSNEGRGYVLRRIMRRGMRHAHSLDNKEPIFHKLFSTLLDLMQDPYPELFRAKDLIINTLYNEESKFKETIDYGLKILDEEILNTKNNIFDGDIAFKLYDTYGFPLDLTEDYLKSKNFKVDKKKFDHNMKIQKERARKSWKGTGEIYNEDNLLDFVKVLAPTEFLGYDTENTESKIISIISENKSVKKLEINHEGYILLNQTPFYAESGGQVGDTGKIKNENFTFEVINTKKIFESYFLHFGKVIKGTCLNDVDVICSINKLKRQFITYNHSSTHLLHAALKKILGNHISQKGSLVNEKKLRFDFSHNDPISQKDLNKIELIVNDIIKQNNKVDIKIIDQKLAIEEGATALFGEKYNDEVRVVTMGKIDNKFFSKELCGGTHVNFTNEIGEFKIINQSSVASGIRRIEAISNKTVKNYLQEISNEQMLSIENLNNQVNKYKLLIKKMNLSNIPELDTNSNLDNKLKILKNFYETSLANEKIKKSEKNVKIEKIGKFNFIYLNTKQYPANSFKGFIDKQKLNNYNSIILLTSYDNEKVSIIIGITDDITDSFDARDLAKLSSKIVGGSGGGGRKDLAQAGGNDIDKIEQIYSFFRNVISNKST